MLCVFMLFYDKLFCKHNYNDYNDNSFDGHDDHGHDDYGDDHGDNNVVWMIGTFRHFNQSL